MIQAQAQKTLIVISPVTLGTGSGTSNAIDTQGFHYANFELTVGATTGAIDPFKIQECATSGGSYTDITDAVLASPPGATDDNKIYSIKVRCGGNRLRYMKAVLTEDATGSGIYGVNVTLSRADEAPNSATERGYEEEVLVA